MRNRPSPRHITTGPLTDYQLDILAWLAVGLTIQQVADKLGKKRGAIQSACLVARHKLGAHNITHAVYIACQQHLLTIE